MKTRPMASLAVLSVASCLLCARAEAADPLGFYIGAGFGASYLQNHYTDYYGYPYGYHSQQTGWQAMLGIRPIPFLGAELEYLDFGSAGYGPYSGPYNNSSNRAGAAFAVGYMPVPFTGIDFYAKLGAGYLETRYDPVSYLGYYPGPAPYRQDLNQTGFAYGVGVQFHLGPVAVRTEYQQILAINDPALLSIAVAFKF
jgi:OmpA-OmpF porin, OOP family